MTQREPEAKPFTTKFEVAILMAAAGPEYRAGASAGLPLRPMPIDAFAEPIRGTSRFLSLGLVLHLVTSFMTIMVVAISATYAVYAWERREYARPVAGLVDISNDLFVAIQNFRLERGVVNTSLVLPAV